MDCLREAREEYINGLGMKIRTNRMNECACGEMGIHTVYYIEGGKEER